MSRSLSMGQSGGRAHSVVEHSPAGSLSPRSHLANVPWSTPISRAASFCALPNDVRCRNSFSANVVASGNGLHPRNSMMAGTHRISGSHAFASQLTTRITSMPVSLNRYAALAACDRV